MIIEQLLSSKISEAVKSLFSTDFPSDKVVFAKTNKEFEGDITLVVFPFVKLSKKTPEVTAQELGEYLQKNVSEVEKFNVVKGFLNLVISKIFWLNYFNGIYSQKDFGFTPITKDSPTIMLEYCGPNTNKPLHLGHVRNILVGWSMIKILEANGNKVIKANIVNDRGIHICKSMIAWKVLAKGETPYTTKDSKLKKGDHFVGHYYVRYNEEYTSQMKYASQYAEKFIDEFQKLYNTGVHGEALKKVIVETVFGLLIYLKLFSWKEDKQINIDLPRVVEFYGKEDDYVAQLTDLYKALIGNYKAYLNKRLNDTIFTPDKPKEFREQIIKIFEDFVPMAFDAHQLLREWELEVPDVRKDWEDMNKWVLEGFQETYNKLGVTFDKTYFESQTYKLGKNIVEEGLSKKAFEEREDGAVIMKFDQKDKLDDKVLLRPDGTSVYITQDIATAILRIRDYPEITKLIYTVGNEQEYHFKVLFKILKRLGYDWADQCYHLSYGMVELPDGKMKSREGTVVDADNLIDEMIAIAKEASEQSGKQDDFTEDEKQKLYHTIALGALKYFILKVDPKKKMLFDPKESIDLNGNTGPFIQYTYTRISSVLRKVEVGKLAVGNWQKINNEIENKEKEVIKLLYDFPNVVKEAGANYSPAGIANYTYELAKCYNQFYHDITILKEEDEQKKNFRIALSQKTGDVIKNAMSLLGIEVPERM